MCNSTMLHAPCLTGLHNPGELMNVCTGFLCVHIACVCLTSPQQIIVADLDICTKVSQAGQR